MCLEATRSVSFSLSVFFKRFSDIIIYTHHLLENNLKKNTWAYSSGMPLKKYYLLGNFSKGKKEGRGGWKDKFGKGKGNRKQRENCTNKGRKMKNGVLFLILFPIWHISKRLKRRERGSFSKRGGWGFKA